MFDVKQQFTRRELLGKPTYWQASDFGAAQLRHQYPADLLDTIRSKALEIKDENSENRPLNLRYIRGAHKLIPEILDLFYLPGRLEALSELAETKLEIYPISVITTAVTFMGPQDGTVDWHGDGVPFTELIALEVDDVSGGALEIYRGDFDEGSAVVHGGGDLPVDTLTHLTHEVGSSIFGQIMRVLHRTEPMASGSRITLTLNHSSAEKPFIDDNPMFYLAADNPTFDWVDEYVDDVRTRQLPAYMATRS
ncbi:hypothetical protein [Rhodococcus sp. H29-C3]|uniref:hypothetical protein n=1 Tax=Rhodococcus sp. H29-C3 TaxID=3046307 RepID=UPI0024BB273C|nr:hypothetical protein [Rhodococcus sp. H29-C3]MDJ0363145.1 hypothetical protein [Rhodococcus sp. H29-C3]